MNDFGTVIAPNTVRIERLLPGPIERVWAYLTESEKRGSWLASGDMDLRIGGQVELVFHNNALTDNDVAPPPKYEKYGGELRSHGHVVECDPPRLLVFTWDEEAEEAAAAAKAAAAGKTGEGARAHCPDRPSR